MWDNLLQVCVEEGDEGVVEKGCGAWLGARASRPARQCRGSGPVGSCAVLTTPKNVATPRPIQKATRRWAAQMGGSEGDFQAQEVSFVSAPSGARPRSKEADADLTERHRAAPAGRSVGRP